MTEVRQAGGSSPEPAPSLSTAARQAAEEAVDRERARMARELHDGIATDLAAAISLFKTYAEAHPGFGKAGGKDEVLGSVFGILERMLNQVRETLPELRPRATRPEGRSGGLRFEPGAFG